MALRADAGYFAGQLARAAHDEKIAFVIGAKRIAPLWRLLAGIGEEAWTEAIEMDGLGRGGTVLPELVARGHPVASQVIRGLIKEYRRAA